MRNHRAALGTHHVTPRPAVARPYIPILFPVLSLIAPRVTATCCDFQPVAAASVHLVIPCLVTHTTQSAKCRQSNAHTRPPPRATSPELNAMAPFSPRLCTLPASLIYTPFTHGFRAAPSRCPCQSMLHALPASGAPAPGHVRTDIPSLGADHDQAQARARPAVLLAPFSGPFLTSSCTRLARQIPLTRFHRRSYAIST